MVIGSVGGGKSSLLQALLGEMVCVGGHVHVKGTVAYTCQVKGLWGRGWGTWGWCVWDWVSAGVWVCWWV